MSEPATTAKIAASKFRKNNLYLLTTLRFFAAAWVFFDHFGKDIFSGAPHILNCAFSNGRMAVTFFFILSGFVLAYSNTANGKLSKSSTEFIAARIARIYPVYFFALLIPLPHKLAVGLTSAERLGLPLVLTLTQSWWPTAAAVWNPPAWSLSVEAFFYLSFPLLVSVLCRFNPKRVLAAAVAVLAIGEVLRAYLLNRTEMFGLAFPPLSLPQFIFGMAMGLCFQDLEQVVQSLLAIFVSAIGVLYALIFFCSPTNSWMVLPAIAVLFGVIIFSGATVKGQVPILVLLGEASYSLYITHMPVMVGFQRAFGVVGFNHPEQSVTVFLLGFCFCTLLSVVLHKLIELPAKRWILKRYKAATIVVPPGLSKQVVE